ncbi:MAG: phosphoribosylanthranilate isomerase [Lachnospiraceae bacterium]|nr:phosphoribosylanthranilate isomerase [Lachnospiraceae bacterium]
MKTQIKLCGIRRDEDAAYANECMPDYIGFIFWEKSFRYVTMEQAASLRRQIDKRIAAVGVFVDAPRQAVCEAVEKGIIQIVQLHGHETEAEIEALKRELSVPVWKAFRIRAADDLRAAQRSCADQILLDNGYGTGECFEHTLLDGFRREYILAGGLTPENIPEVIEKYHPQAVDLSSGVETDRRKDREKMKRAVAAVRNARRHI